MRAYVLEPGKGIDGLRIVERPDPQPKAGEVLIRVRATSLNYRDLMMTRRAQQEVIPLSDGAGKVVAVGDGVAAFKPGEHVAGCFFTTWEDGAITQPHVAGALGGAIDGMLAELVALPASAVVPAPAHMSHEETATLPCAALTSWNAMFETTRQIPGNSALLLGTGGVSIFGLQLAEVAGMQSIITSSSNEKLERAKQLGADVTINYREQENWDQHAREATGGRGVDIVLEVGGSGTYARSMAATATGGHVVSIGALANDPEAATPIPGFGVTATRVYVGNRAMFERMNRALELHQVRPVIDRVFEFDEAAEAYRHLESQAHFGKIVVRV